jgi:hypothetical protein
MALDAQRTRARIRAKEGGQRTSLAQGHMEGDQEPEKRGCALYILPKVGFYFIL